MDVVSVIFDYTVKEGRRKGVLIGLRVQFPAFVKWFTNADVLDWSRIPSMRGIPYTSDHVSRLKRSFISSCGKRHIQRINKLKYMRVRIFIR